MAVPAGWYDDGSGRQRWWDGTAWTEHTVATPPEPTTPATSDTAGQPTEHQRAEAASADPAFEPPYSWQPSSPSPGSSEGTPFGGHSSTPGTPVASYDASGGLGAHGSPTPKENTTPSVVGIIGLGAAVLGAVLACIPPISVAGGVLLGIGFVLSLISLFLRGAKWPGVLGLVAAVLGGIVAIAVMLLTFGAASLSAIAPTDTATPQETQGTDPDDTTTPPEDTGGAEGAETVTVNELEVGHCIPLIEWEEAVYELPIVPCDTPHTDEVYFIFDAPDGEFPGDDGLQTLAADRCDAAFVEFVGVPYADSELDNYWFVPTESSWKRMNDRAIQCIVISYDEITGTLEGADR